MHYTKQYKLITPNYDLEKVFKFLQSHNYAKQIKGLFKNTYNFLKSVEDDFENVFELSVIIVDNKDSITFELNSINNEELSIGIKKYMRLLTETCFSILRHNDYKEELWKRFYAQVKKRKSAFNIGNFILDILDAF
jgi:hypothetical protein